MVIFTIIFFTVTYQVRSITDLFIPHQSGSVLYKRAKLTGAQYKYRYIIILGGNHRVIFTLDVRIKLLNVTVLIAGTDFKTLFFYFIPCKRSK